MNQICRAIRKTVMHKHGQVVVDVLNSLNMSERRNWILIQSDRGDVHLITFVDLTQTLDDMKQAADKLLKVTKELKEVVSKSWIR